MNSWISLNYVILSVWKSLVALIESWKWIRLQSPSFWLHKHVTALIPTTSFEIPHSNPRCNDRQLFRSVISNRNHISINFARISQRLWYLSHNFLNRANAIHSAWVCWGQFPFEIIDVTIWSSKLVSKLKELAKCLRAISCRSLELMKMWCDCDVASFEIAFWMFRLSELHSSTIVRRSICCVESTKHDCETKIEFSENCLTDFLISSTPIFKSTLDDKFCSDDCPVVLKCWVAKRFCFQQPLNPHAIRPARNSPEVCWMSLVWIELWAWHGSWFTYLYAPSEKLI